MTRFWRSRVRTTGLPPSGNGASSFHLHWGIPTGEPLREVRATIEVLEPPAVPRLYFWALQVGFRGGGAGHTGLQWLPAGGAAVRAVNWGGYGPGGRELDGTVSALPSLDGNPNTRLYDWDVGRAHVLRVFAAPTGDGWRAAIDDVVIRDLLVPSLGPAAGLVSPIVWSEVFAPCDAPPVTVRWSDLSAVTASGADVRADRVSLTYQSRADGGCDNTDVEVDDVGVRQTTGVARRAQPGETLALPRRGAR